MPKITLDTVKAARARAVADPAILVQGSLAVNKKGENVSATSKSATCFCTLGLIANEAGIDTKTSAKGDPYQLIADGFDKESWIGDVIECTDRLANRNRAVTPHCPAHAVAGLAGFDYLINAMEVQNGQQEG